MGQHQNSAFLNVVPFLLVLTKTCHHILLVSAIGYEANQIWKEYYFGSNNDDDDVFGFDNVQFAQPAFSTAPIMNNDRTPQQAPNPTVSTPLLRQIKCGLTKNLQHGGLDTFGLSQDSPSVTRKKRSNRLSTLIGRQLLLPLPDADANAMQTTTKVFTRIVGGQQALLNQIPWQVYIIFFLNNNSTAACGGSIISASFILTAAHCVTEPNNVKITAALVFAGYVQFPTDFRFNATVHECGKIIVSAKRIILHPNYNGVTNDIALLELVEPLDLSLPCVGTICLPPAQQNKSPSCRNNSFDDAALPVANQPLAASGFGCTNVFDIDSKINPPCMNLPTDTLFWLQLQFVPDIDPNCFGLRSALSFQARHCAQMCARSALGNNHGTCFGDSGGALVAIDRTSLRHYQVGVVSMGPAKCATNGTVPMIFTQVTSYVDSFILPNVPDAQRIA